MSELKLIPTKTSTSPTTSTTSTPTTSNTSPNTHNTFDSNYHLSTSSLPSSHQSSSTCQTNSNQENVMSVYLRETPSNEAFNSDPDLIRILNKNQIIIDNHPPLFLLHPTQADENGTNSQSSKSVLHIITYTHLYKFRRFPQSESLYSSEFSKTVKAKYGSSSRYLKDRLGFNRCSSELRFDRDGKPIDYFKADPGLIDGLDYKVIKNEWPYAIDHGYQHMIVWSRLKLLNPALSKSPTQWHLALEQGLSGFVNLSNGMKHKLHSFNLLNKLKSSNSDDSLEEHSNPLAIEMIKFIKNRWFGYEDLMWFLNPVQLQSCPDLPHFHVFVKTQGWSEW